MDIFEKCSAPSLAKELKEAGVYPYFHALQSRQDVEVQMEGKRRIMLGSNNYLGLTTDPEVIEAGIRALEQYGTGCSGSRFLNGTLEMHLELEAELARFLRKPGVVTFGTGFQSNVGIISALVGRHDYVICDRENHASIYAGCQLSYGKMLRYRHSDMAELEKCLQKVPETAGALIVTDGVFSMGGDIAKLPEICALAKQYGARVMVDDAHGLGVLGEGGRGTASYFGLEDQVDVYMGTFSKSLASLGGYMAASEEVADYVRHVSRPFIFSASIPPANCAAALAALRELEAAGYIVRHQLRDRQGRISDTEYVIYEQPQPKNPDTPQPDTASPDTENPDMVKPDTEKPTELNIEKSNTEKTITYGSSTDSIPFRETAAARPPERKGRDAMSVTEIENYRELILENIEYDCLKQRYPLYLDDLNEIVELLVETVCAKRKTTRISGADFPHEIVRSRFLKLDSSHIEFVMDCLQKNTTQVHNIKQYLLAVLFNAPTTMNNHYTSLVNHDMHAGGW